MKKYIIKKIETTPSVEDWAIADVAQMNVESWEGMKFHFNSFARLLYDDDAIYVCMESDEMPVVAKLTERNSPVCTESCMEFFFCPNIENGKYFNFEFNALGTLNLALGAGRNDRIRPTEELDTFDIKPQLMENGWKISFKIPFDFIKKYVGMPTTQMRGNFYKCRSDEEKKHSSAWNLIETPRPDFHQPDYFGYLEFEE